MSTVARRPPLHRRTFVATTALVVTAGCSAFDHTEPGDFDRGEMDVVVDGDPVDLSADRFQAEHADDHSIDFHFHEFDDYWYMEGEPVTFAEAVDRIPRFAFERRDGEFVVTVDGTTYDGGEPGAEFAFFVDGDAVDPTAYEVADGDHLELVVTTG